MAIKDLFTPEENSGQGPYLDVLDKYSVWDLVKAIQNGELEGIDIKNFGEIIFFVTLNKRTIGIFRIPFSGGIYNIFVYPTMEAVTCTYSGPGLGGFSRYYRHLHDFITENPSLSHVPEFQAMDQEMGFSVNPPIIPFKKPVLN